MTLFPTDASNSQQEDALRQTLSIWLSISSRREQRRFLEAHSELLDLRSETILSEHLEQQGQSVVEERRLQDALSLLRDARSRTGAQKQSQDKVRTAIREAYVNMYGGLVLDLPLWLENVEYQLNMLLHADKFPHTLQKLTGLLSEAVAYAENDQHIAPEIIAAFRYELAEALRENPSLDLVQTLEEAIVACQAALHVYTLACYPRQYVKTLNVLALVYRERLRGERWENIEQSIKYFEEALYICIQEEFSLEYALIQSNLGISYRKRVTGERRENIERAIACFEEALRIYTLESFPIDYARTQNNLGNAYDERIAGERRENIERAIACFEEALRVRTPEHFPIDYALTRNNLGISYRKRIAGERRENIERAIFCFKEKLRIHTLDLFPREYARTQNNLANAYFFRIAGERRENLEYAIVCLQEALKVFSQHISPYEYAKTRNNLGNIYCERIAGERQENLKNAIACFQDALKYFSVDAHPGLHRLIAFQCEETAAELKDWSAVHEYYNSALEAEDLLMSLGAGVLGRDAILREGRDAAIRNGFALIRLGRLQEAIVAIERGRARGLAEAIAFDAADPERIASDERRERYKEARQSFILTQATLQTPLPQALDEDEQRLIDLQRTASYREAKMHFDAVVAEIRAAGDPADFLNAPLDITTILQAVQCGGSRHALVYLAATPWGGFALAAFNAHPHQQTVAPFSFLDLPSLTTEFINGLIETRLDDDADHIVGGFDCAQKGNALDLLHTWPGETLREKAVKLHHACMETVCSGTLDTAVQFLLTTPDVMQFADFPLAHLNATQIALLRGSLNYALLQHELARCMPPLAATALQPLSKWLQGQAFTSVTLVPCGALATFPLLTTPLENGQTLTDVLPASVAPSARALLHGQRRDSKRTGVYALGNPYPILAEQSLKWGEAEALTLAQIGDQLNLPAAVKVEWEATRAWLLEAFQQASIVDASCHGTFDEKNFLRSRLFLARGEALTLADALNYQVSMYGLRLLILSACQTAMLDLRGALDEVRSLAAAMLQVGADAVLASLWKVDDKATYLLMVRFAQEWFPNMEHEPPAAALARAQQWLRTVKNSELEYWHASLPTIPLETPKLATNGVERFLTIRSGGYRFSPEQAEIRIQDAANASDPDLQPYANPYYWAGFQIAGW